jgi:hypothetical protein
MTSMLIMGTNPRKRGAQYHSTSWYKDIRKLEDIVNRDRKKGTLCQFNGIYFLEIW